MIAMSFVFQDLKTLPESFSQMVDWIRNPKQANAETFHTEFAQEADESTWVSPTFKDYLDGSTKTVVKDTATTANDGLALGLYGTGTWDSDERGYTIGTGDSISFTPNDGWAYEIQETNADGATNTVVVLPAQKYENDSEGTIVTLMRVQTPEVKSADGATELGVLTLQYPLGSMAVGDNVAPIGCTDDTSTNYDANAMIDDGSCEFAEWYESIPTWGWVVGGVAVVGLVMGMKR